MFIVYFHDWNSGKSQNIGPFASAEAATLWIEGQRLNDNEDIDYEICEVSAP